MRFMTHRALAAILAAAAVLAPGLAIADDGPATPALEGLRSTIDPGMLFGSGAAGTTFALSGHLGYGINVGGVIVSPGVSVPFYTFSNNFTLAPMGEVKVHYPIGMLAPYVRGGAGVAIFTGLGSTDLAARAGGGAMFYPLKQFGVGADVAWQKLGNLDGLQLTFPIALNF